VFPELKRNENFKIAEEKATKAIQRHSMLIQGKERNPQIDEAHLLLGKARYYDERFIPALEAFNYILHKYPASNTISHAQIWREKTNMRMENDRLAIKNLKRLIESGRLEKQDRADAHAVLAQAYINTGALDSAVVPIRTAAIHTGSNKEKARYFYIEGQLHNLLQNRDSANVAFQNVIALNRRIPREFLVNARLEKIRNFDFSTGNRHELLAKLREMEEDRENRPFLDKIYFQLAEYYNYLDSSNVAVENYNRSLKATSGDRFLQAVNYETLGNLYFDQSQYRTAGAYFDSTLTRLPNTTRDYFVVKRKRDNLQEVIMYEEIVDKNDSILDLVAMSEARRLDYFIKYTNELKEQAVEEAKRGGLAEAAPVPQGPVIRSPGAPPALGGPNSSSNFYFYNPARVNTGNAGIP
jgi:tetratricopeptide (TPR) repeat protein